MKEIDTATTGHFGFLMPVDQQAERITALNGVTDLDSQEEIDVLPPRELGDDKEYVWNISLLVSLSIPMRCYKGQWKPL